jgi:hypothetical protein
MSSQVIPNSQDTAVVLEQGAGLTEGTDFEIQDYTSAEEDGYNVYSYVVKMTNTDDYTYKICRYLASDSEYYILTGTVTKDDAQTLANVQNSMDTFQVLSAESTIHTTQSTAQESGDGTDAASGDASGESATTDDGSTEQAAANGGIVPYRDNPDNTDNTKTRTIYRNSDGHPLVISINSDGVWVDADGNQYRFSTLNECDVYDQNDVDYYYHGEAADVYYMPVE